MGKRKRVRVDIDEIDDVSIFRHGSPPAGAKRASTEPVAPAVGAKGTTTLVSDVGAKRTTTEPLVPPLKAKSEPQPTQKHSIAATEVVLDDESDLEIVSVSEIPPKLPVPPPPPKPKQPPILLRYDCIIPGKHISGEQSIERDVPLYEFYEDTLSNDDDDFIFLHKGTRIASYLTPGQLVPKDAAVLEVKIMTRAQSEAPEPEPEPEPEQEEPNEVGDGYFIIGISFKDRKNLKLAVKADSALSKVVQFIKDKRPDAAQSAKGIKLVFDDEPMDVTKCIGDYDMEADDCVDAYF